MRRLLTICFLLCGIAGATVPEPCNHYAFSRTLTIDHTKVPNTDRADFPAMWCANTTLGNGASCATVADLKTVANGGAVQNTTTNVMGVTEPADFAVCVASQPGTPLSHEVELYTAATGAFVVHFRVPNVSTSVDTVVYIGYGDAAIIASQDNVPDVWRDYDYVLHMNGNANDSTLHAHNGTSTSITYNTGNGMAAQGAGYANSPSSVSLGAWAENNYSYASNGFHDMTFEAWYNATAFSNSYNSIESNEAGTGCHGHTLLVKSSGKLAIYLDSGPNYDGSGSNTLSTGTWYQLAWSYKGSSGSNTLTGYVNGVSDGTSSGAWTGPNYGINSCTQLIGNSSFTTRNLNAKLDEVRFSRVLRSADWLLTEKNMWTAPTTFYTVGSAVAGATCGSAGQYAIPVTIDHTKVPSTQSNYQYVLSTTYKCFATKTNGGSTNNANGYDIGVFSDNTCTTRLASEMPDWDSTTGRIQLYGLISSVSSSVDTPLWACTGNPSISTDQSNKTTLWGAQGVVNMMHFGTPSSLGLVSSGGDGLTFTGTGVAATGLIGGGVKMPTSSDSLGFVPGTPYLLSTFGYPVGSTAPRSITTYIRGNDNTYAQCASSGECSPGGYGCTAHGGGCTGATGFVLQHATPTSSNSYLGLNTGQFSSGSPSIATSFVDFDDGRWHRVDAVCPTNGGAISTCSVYLGGVVDGAPTLVSGATVLATTDGGAPSASEVRIGRDAAHSAGPWVGWLDEFRVTSTAPSADRITTETNNQTAPWSFSTLGTPAVVTSGSVRHRVTNQ
jgi:hypothetical protein